MWENKSDELDMFSSTPLQKWKDIIFNASRTLASKELERIIEELAIYELALEECSNGELNLREFYYKAHNDLDLKERLKTKINSLALESMSRILSENE